MSIWVLITYMLNPQPAVLVPGQDPHVISQLEFKTRELCERAKQSEANEDAKNGIAGQFEYKCEQRKT
jgi:hypothetical protein